MRVSSVPPVNHKTARYAERTTMYAKNVWTILVLMIKTHQFVTHVMIKGV